MKGKPAAKSRRKPTPYAEGSDGVLYVLVSAVMHPLIPLTDGLPITFFGKSKRAKPYLTVDQAIDWCEKEQQFRNDPKRATVLVNLKRAKEAQASGNLSYNE